MSFSVCVNLTKIRQNIQKLRTFANSHGCDLVGVTKGICGESNIANEFIAAGVMKIADSRLQNIAKLKKSGIEAEFILIRPPVIAELKFLPQMVSYSYHCNNQMIYRTGKVMDKRKEIKHGIVLLIDLNTGREGFNYKEVDDAVRLINSFQNLYAHGIAVYFGKKLAALDCIRIQKQLVKIAENIRQRHGILLPSVSVGSSIALGIAWKTGYVTTGITELRVGTAALLGIASSQRLDYLEGLSNETISLFTEIIYIKKIHSETQVIVALGHLDVEPKHLIPPVGVEIINAFSDHMILRVNTEMYLTVGQKLKFGINYYAMSRIMQSPYADLIFKGEKP